MQFLPTKLQGAFLIKPQKLGDQRGAFARLFCEDELRAQGLAFTLRQANYSYTRQKGSLRGLHFQLPPKAEDKIVRCTKGSVFDVIVDLRQGSPSFLQWQGFELSDSSLHSLLIPKGFAHGFQTLTDDVEMHYLHSEFYAPECEDGVHYLDPKINVAWPLAIADISDKDLKRPYLAADFHGISL